MKRPSQADRLLKLLSDGQEHSTDEIQRLVYGADHLGTARIASRVDDLRARGYDIPKAYKKDRHSTIYWYQMKLEGKAAPQKKFIPQFVIVNGVRRVRMVEA